MEGAVLAGKLAAQVVAEGAIGKAHQAGDMTPRTHMWCLMSLCESCEVKTVPDFIQEEPAKAPVGAHRFWMFLVHVVDS